MVPGLTGNLPFTARVEAQLDAVANAYFRPQSDIPEAATCVAKAAIPIVHALQFVLLLPVTNRPLPCSLVPAITQCNFQPLFTLLYIY